MSGTDHGLAQAVHCSSIGIGSHGATGSGASVSSISRRRHSNWRSSSAVWLSVPVNSNAIDSSVSWIGPAQVLALRGLEVVVRRIADVLEGADVALAVLRALDAALVGLGARDDALVDREALAEDAVRERRAAVVRDRVELRVAAAVPAVLDRVVRRRRLVEEARRVRRQHDLERDRPARRRMPPPSRLPPSESMYQSQLPPSRLPPMIVFRAMTARFGCGGTSGTKSDSTTPTPPPIGAELRQMVLLSRRTSPSASWKRPPPPTAALLPGDRRVLDLRVAVGHAEEAAAASAFLGVAVLGEARGCARRCRGCSERLMKKSASGRFATPPPSCALFRWMVESWTVKSPLDEL